VSSNEEKRNVLLVFLTIPQPSPHFHPACTRVAEFELDSGQEKSSAPSLAHQPFLFLWSRIYASIRSFLVHLLLLDRKLELLLRRQPGLFSVWGRILAWQLSHRKDDLSFATCTSRAMLQRIISSSTNIRTWCLYLHKRRHVYGVCVSCMYVCINWCMHVYVYVCISIFDFWALNNYFWVCILVFLIKIIIYLWDRKRIIITKTVKVTASFSCGQIIQWLTPKSGKSPNSRHFWEDGDRVCRACRWLRTLQIVKVDVF
jgi:hypothetical protein